MDGLWRVTGTWIAAIAMVLLAVFAVPASGVFLHDRLMDYGPPLFIGSVQIDTPTVPSGGILKVTLIDVEKVRDCSASVTPILLSEEHYQLALGVEGTTLQVGSYARLLRAYALPRIEPGRWRYMLHSAYRCPDGREYDVYTAAVPFEVVPG